MTAFNGDEFVKEKLHEMFVELGEKVAETSDDEKFTASVPMQMFRAEEYMRMAWDSFLIEDNNNWTEQAYAKLRARALRETP